MSDFNSPELALSHKQLNDLLSKAPKENFVSTCNENTQLGDQKVFNDLLIEWSAVSQKLLKELRKKDKSAIKDRSPKSIMALGALESYLFLSIQAKEASEANEEEL